MELVSCSCSRCGCKGYVPSFYKRDISSLICIACSRKITRINKLNIPEKINFSVCKKLLVTLIDWLNKW